MHTGFLLKNEDLAKFLAWSRCASPKLRLACIFCDMTRLMLAILRALLVALSRSFRSRRDLVLENLALRQQLVVLATKHPHPGPVIDLNAGGTQGRGRSGSSPFGTRVIDRGDSAACKIGRSRNFGSRSCTATKHAFCSTEERRAARSSGSPSSATVSLAANEGHQSASSLSPGTRYYLSQRRLFLRKNMPAILEDAGCTFSPRMQFIIHELWREWIAWKTRLRKPRPRSNKSLNKTRVAAD
jgi:hypothetical protein